VYKIIIILILLFTFNNCSNQINYSGKVLSNESLDNINYKNKDNLLSKLGMPSYIDPISKKYYYFSEKKEKKSIFNQRTYYSYIFVFEFDENEKVIASNVFDLNNKKDIKIIEDTTSNEIVKRGLLERIFGGVGPQKEITTSP
tara:strand:- start:174 stop:602 length:429 start_codon:yes stop_codon:yes gene_type:complete